MSSDDHYFYFSSLDSQRPSTTRKVHIRRLYDVFQLCIHRRDFPRAICAWAILSRCKEFHWLSMWTTAVHILGEDAIEGQEKDMRKFEFLRTMMLQHDDLDQRQMILKELIFRLILAGKHREALDELELYLPSFPYQDNPVLHIYGGLISLYLSQPLNPIDSTPYKPSLLNDAQSYFERAIILDADNAMARAFSDKIRVLQVGTHMVQPDGNSDDESVVTDDTTRLRKRVRV